MAHGLREETHGGRNMSWLVTVYSPPEAGRGGS